MSHPAKAYDEELINYFEEQLVTHADLVYRFAFALTLSLDGASQCVRRTYEQVAAQLERLRGGDSSSFKQLLIKTCWQVFKELKAKNFTKGQSSVTKALEAMDVEARAVLVAVDVSGLTPADAAKAFDTNEKELRMQLAKARRALMLSTLS